jgi:hypothetical protein
LQHYAEAEHAYQSAFKIAVDVDTPADRCAVLRRQGALSHVRQQYRDALEFWVQALALDQRLGHPARKDLQERVEALVQEQELGEIYEQLSKKYGLT